MDSARIGDLPGLLRTLADDMSTLPDPAILPRVVNWRVLWDEDADTLAVHAQLSLGFSADDLDRIAAINQWATALGGAVRLGDEVAAPDYYWRRLAAVAELPGGLRAEVWTHLTYQLPTGAVTTAARLLAA